MLECLVRNLTAFVDRFILTDEQCNNNGAVYVQAKPINYASASKTMLIINILSTRRNFLLVKTALIDIL